MYDEDDQCREIACRARSLVDTFGTTLGAGRDYSVDNYTMTVLEAGHLVVSNIWPLCKIYIQQAPRSKGRLVHPELADELLASLRRFMILEDLANV